MTMYTNTHPVSVGGSRCLKCGKPVSEFRWATEACPEISKESN